MRCFGLVLLLLSPAIAHAETPLSAPVLGPAAFSQGGTLIASDGNDYLAVWGDNRIRESRDGWAARVSRDGELLDKSGFRIANIRGGRVGLVWAGSSYVLVLSKGSNGSEGIEAVRIGRDGSVGAPRSFTFFGSPTSVVSNGSEIVVTYHTGGVFHIVNGVEAWQGEIRALVFRADPLLTFVNDVPLAPNTLGRLYGKPVVASNDSHFAAVWYASGRVEGIRFNAAGLIDSAPHILGSAATTRPLLLASDGSDFLMLKVGADQRWRATPISGDLQTVGSARPVPVLVEDAPVEPARNIPELLWAGSQYLILSDRSDVMHGMHVDRTGQLLGDPVEIARRGQSLGPSGGMGPSAASNGSDVLVGWNGPVRTLSPFLADSDVQGTLMSADTLHVRSTQLLTMSAPAQDRVRIASSGKNLLAVWLEESVLWGRRLSTDGAPLDPQPVRLATNVLWSTGPAVVFNGSDYIVAWVQFKSQAERDELTTRRVPAEGPWVAIDADKRVIDFTIKTPVLVRNRDETFLVWDGHRGLQAGLLNSDGSLGDGSPLLIASSAWAFDAAANDDELLVVWTEFRQSEISMGNVPAPMRAARVTNGLSLRDPNGILVGDTSALQMDHSVVWDGSQWVVYWTHDSGGWQEIRGSRISAGGTVLDGTVADPGVVVVPDGVLPSAIWDGARYRLTWLDAPRADRQPAIYAATMVFPFGIDNVRTIGRTDYAPYYAHTPDFARLANGALLLAYVRVAEEPQYGGVSRAFLDIPRTPRRRAVR